MSLILKALLFSVIVPLCGHNTLKTNNYCLPESIKSIKSSGTTFYVGTWICPTNVRNTLIVGPDQPLIARELAYRFSDIKWRAGEGWPWYYVPCPYSTKKHAIIMEFGGDMNTTCDMSGHFRGSRATPVTAYVLDEKTDDNVGTFKVEVTFVKTD